ncbi:hypothetical protein GLOIN_2v1770483 [Rhizophagus clarus]|uniref:Uncharacterized protein n=1 Tax=Rhizophagus clarus TaxID=94130 RepID=A0A8H3QMC2_9GLOM|nr:hypothetical protein GLOIN_2v1770483 [Rhizophagus clarus]
MSLKKSSKDANDSQQVYANNRSNDRTRKYDNELQYYDFMLPENASHWSYVDQLNIIYNTEYSERIAEEDNDIEDEELNVIINSMEIAGWVKI